MGNLPRLPAALLLALLSSCALPDEKEAPGELPEPRKIGKLPERQIPESSGLVKSPAHADVFWTLNDSGNAAQIHAVKPTGELLRIVALCAENLDWEDLATDEKGRLIVADCGDNYQRRPELQLYRCAEPDPGVPPSAPLPVDTFRFTFPKPPGPSDVEAVVVRAGWAYVFTKERGRTRALRLPLPEEPPAEPVVLEPVGETDTIDRVSGASLSPDGRALAILSLDKVMVFEWPVPLEQTPGADGSPRLFRGRTRARAIRIGQAEAIAWDGNDLVISTEQEDLFRIEKAR